MIKLKHIVHGAVVSEIEMTEGDFTIGRNDGNNLQLDGGGVSGEHAVITLVADSCIPEMFDITIRDLNSTNGVYLGEKQVKEAVAVLQLNTELYPESWNVWDSLAEAWLAAGLARPEPPPRPVTASRKAPLPEGWRFHLNEVVRALINRRPVQLFLTASETGAERSLAPLIRLARLRGVEILYDRKEPAADRRGLSRSTDGQPRKPDPARAQRARHQPGRDIKNHQDIA